VTPQIGIIGGSGLYAIPGFTHAEEVWLESPFGWPSDAYMVGELEGRQVAFLARHGRGHKFSPSELNFRANIYAMKVLGVERILSASAVGSLREELAPMDILLPDQFVDRTRGRISTFFGNGIAAHIAFGDPLCPELVDHVHASATRAGIKTVKGGTYVCMEGPAFSTRAESNLYRSWGMDVIGMTNLQEAKLAREAEICYMTLALVTDYDCWHDSHESVTVEMILNYLQQNSRSAQRIIIESVRTLAESRKCQCGSALKYAIITDRNAVPADTLTRLAPIVGKYLGGA